MPPFPGFDMIGHIDSSKTIVLSRKSAETGTYFAMSDIMSIRDIISIKLQIHDTLLCVFNNQTQMHLDIFGGINVTWGQHLFANPAANCAIQCVAIDLLCVLGQSNQVGISSFGSASKTVFKLAALKQYEAELCIRMRRAGASLCFSTGVCLPKTIKETRV